MLAKEGIFAQPAASVSIAAINKLRREGVISKQFCCAVPLTGSGLKFSGILKKQKPSVPTSKLEDLKEDIAFRLND